MTYAINCVQAFIAAMQTLQVIQQCGMGGMWGAPRLMAILPLFRARVQ